MATCGIAPELNLRKIIAESREFAQAVNEFADNLERIEKKYAKDTCEDFEPQESEEDVVEAEEEQEPKIGRWEKTFDEHSYWYKCSCCGEKIPKNFWGNDYFSPYCPECGAKMEVEE